MSLLVASILFMGAVTGIANRQPHVPREEVPRFDYSYAISFYMLNLAFLLDELSGVFSVYLFIIRHKETIKRRHNKLRVQKTKGMRMQLYMRRQSRLFSASSACGEASRRSSNLVSDAEVLPQYAICGRVRKDPSHMTMLTTVGSQLRLSEAEVDETLDENCTSYGILLAPPKDFQSTECQQLPAHAKQADDDSQNDISVYNYKTTSV